MPSPMRQCRPQFAISSGRKCGRKKGVRYSPEHTDVSRWHRRVYLVEAAGVGLPRSVEFSNDFENSIGSIGKKRQKAPVQVQNRYRRSAGVSSDSQRHPLNERSLQASRDEAPGSSLAAGPVDLRRRPRSVEGPWPRTLPPSSAISARSSWLPASDLAKEPRLCGPPVPHDGLG